jgi:DNA polymerase III delta subunit
MGVAKRLGPATVKRAYQLIVEADRTHKLGEVDQEVAIELLIIKLCALGQPVPVRR